jgi:hypothetical protein
MYPSIPLRAAPRRWDMFFLFQTGKECKSPPTFGVSGPAGTHTFCWGALMPAGREGSWTQLDDSRGQTHPSTKYFTLFHWIRMIVSRLNNSSVAIVTIIDSLSVEVSPLTLGGPRAAVSIWKPHPPTATSDTYTLVQIYVHTNTIHSWVHSSHPANGRACWMQATPQFEYPKNQGRSDKESCCSRVIRVLLCIVLMPVHT